MIGIRHFAAVYMALLLVACGSASLPHVKPGTDSVAWYQDPALTELLDRETHSRVVQGNSVQLLVNGRESFARRHENLKDATFILVKTFIWTDDQAGRHLAEAIAERARAGVPVVIQYDVKGNLGSLAAVKDMLSRVSIRLPVGEPRLMAKMRRAGAYIVATNSLARPIHLREWVDNVKRFFRHPGKALRRSWQSIVLFDHVDHDKYFITGHPGGEVRAIMGGLNIASEYAYGGIENSIDPDTGKRGWRDTDIEIRGPTSVALVDEFFADIRRHRGKDAPDSIRNPIEAFLPKETTKDGDTALRLVTHNPLFGEKHRIDRLYRMLILATPRDEDIFLSTPYFAPSKAFRQALLKHMKGGGSVTVLTNSYESNDIRILSDACRYSARKLMKSPHFRLFERIPRPDLGETMLHHKIASFGTHGPMVIGSANLDAQSFVHNGEAVVVVQDSELRARFDEMVEIDMAPGRARRIGAKVVNSPSFGAGLQQFVAGKLAWYWL